MDVFDTIHLQPISIHAPVKGATPAKPGFYKDTLDFNPRSREGSDVDLVFNTTAKAVFQSTLPSRERRHEAAQHIWPLKFQSTLP